MLVSPTVISLQRMIDVCETYANNNGLIFNEKKSVVVTFVKSRFVNASDPQLVIQGHRLSWVSRLTHLGILAARQATW